jgi:hypothetical protein
MAQSGQNKKKQLIKLALAFQDITAALQACDLMLERKPGLGTPLYDALNSAIVISYARPFTDNKPLGPLSNRWSRFENSRHRELHDDLLRTRKRLVAHSDASERVVRVVPRGAEFMPGERSEGGGFVVSSSPLAPEVFEEVREVFNDLGGRLMTAVYDLIDDIYGVDFYAPTPIELRVDEV